MSYKMIAVTVVLAVVTLYLALAIGGVFAYDREAYICVQGLEAKTSFISNTPRGCVYTVKLDRGLGPDRMLYTSLSAGEAWQFYGMWNKRNVPDSLLKLLGQQ